jgi:hypothetical protein
LVVPGHPKKLSIALNNMMETDPPDALKDDLFEPHPRQASSPHDEAPAAIAKAALVASGYTPHATGTLTETDGSHTQMPQDAFVLDHGKTPQPPLDPSLPTPQWPSAPKATTTAQDASTVVSNTGQWSACGTQDSQEPRIPSSDGPPLASNDSNKYDLLDSSGAITDNTAAAAATIAASAPPNTAVAAAPPAATNFTDIIFNSAAASAASAAAATAPSSFSCASVGAAAVATANISYAASNTTASPAVGSAFAATRMSSTASSITRAAAAAPSSLSCGAAAAAADHHIIQTAAAASQIFSSCDPSSQLSRQHYCPLPAHALALLYSLVPPVHPTKRARPSANDDKENDGGRFVPEGAPPSVRARHENSSPSSSSLAAALRAAASPAAAASDSDGPSTFDPRIPSHQHE